MRRRSLLAAPGDNQPNREGKSAANVVYVQDAFTKTGLCLCLCEVVARLPHMTCLGCRGQGCWHRELQAGNQQKPGQIVCGAVEETWAMRSVGRPCDAMFGGREGRGLRAKPEG